MTRLAIAVGVLLAGVTAPAFGQTKLEWKFKEGDKFYVEEVTNVKTTFQIMGKDLDETQKTTTVASYAVKKATDKEVVLEQKYESVNVVAKGGLAGGDGGLGKIQEKMKGSKFTITLDRATGKVTKLEGYKEMLKAIENENAEVAKFAEMLITEDSLKKGTEDAFSILPPKEVAKGDTWKQESVMPFEPVGSFKKTATYTYDGKEGAGDKISYKLALVYNPPKGDGAFGGLFKITKGNLKADEAKGTIVFDAAKGRMISNELTMKMAGPLTLDLMGNELGLTLTMELTNTSRVLDQAPRKEN